MKHKVYNTLSEKDKRLYAAIEAIKIGHGGITYIVSDRKHLNLQKKHQLQIFGIA